MAGHCFERRGLQGFFLLSLFFFVVPVCQAALPHGQKLPRSRAEKDTYYRQAKEHGYRARSAFKLLQLDEEFGLLENVTRAIDLCSAPGSWTQVLTNRLRGEGRVVVSIDIQKMKPVAGAVHIRGDITARDTALRIWDALGRREADLIVCDGAPDVTGLHELDRHVGDSLVHAAVLVACSMLREGGTLVAKRFGGGG
eukprot:CAMPEP_0181320350 /NCGR_PEP_ID=MMETSP1101-20121128/18079_1 /TAXON_ID=46948 /ORGANISM="Rhodomonas abbreviata, Strain Caron Lab Isolate" /LENGTH=196 /DNA_ID=CAMNT_0023428053 /DNA_START=13 /DNA_END=600 /DNA_ORIENTATION=-